MVIVEGVLSGISVDHERASVETIAEATPADSDAALAALLSTPSVSEAFVLYTCNRAEAYVVTPTAEAGRKTLDEQFDTVSSSAVRRLSHDKAIEHLARVAAGLESQVLGEDEILGQFRDAYQHAIAADAVGDVLEPVLLKAIRVGERARSETTINEGIVSLASAAVSCAEEWVDLETAAVVVVGAGDVGSRAATALADRDVASLTVANRTTDRAADLLTDAEATVIDLESLPNALESANLCITATAADEPILTPDVVPPTCSLVLVDLGQPPNVSPAVRERANVAYFDLDRLREITERTHERRSNAAAEVEGLIDGEIDALHRQFKRQQAEAVIAAMRAGADRIKERERERAKDRLAHADDPADAVIDDLADALVNAILAAPTEGLRDAAEDEDWSTIHAAIMMFDPDIDIADLPDAIAASRAFAADD